MNQCPKWREQVLLLMWHICQLIAAAIETEGFPFVSSWSSERHPSTCRLFHFICGFDQCQCLVRIFFFFHIIPFLHLPPKLFSLVLVLLWCLRVCVFDFLWFTVHCVVQWECECVYTNHNLCAYACSAVSRQMDGSWALPIIPFTKCDPLKRNPTVSIQ